MSATAPAEAAASLVAVGEFPLECGRVLPEVQVAVRTWGRLDGAGSNGVLVCHALTGSADVEAWWPGLLGPGRALDPERDFVVCGNVLGSCYGTTGPTSPRPGRTGVWGPDFPPITIRDMVRLQARVLDSLGVRRLRLVVGGSLGGMQALEWVAEFGDRVDGAVALAAPARQSAWAIALGHAQRAAIRLDPQWQEGRYEADAPPREGLAAARAMAMCSYRSWESLERRFGRQAGPAGFAVEGYLRHQGEMLAARFDANAYVTLTRAMDTHDLGRGRGGLTQVLAGIATPLMVVAIDSDVLFPAEELWELVDSAPAARLEWLASPHGHDAFLTEPEEVNRMVLGFRDTLTTRVREGE